MTLGRQTASQHPLVDRRSSLSTWQLRLERSSAPVTLLPRVNPPAPPEPGTWVARPAPAAPGPVGLIAPGRPPVRKPADPWEASLHRKTPVPPSPTMLALRTLAIEAPVDTFQIHKILEQKQKDRRAGDEEAIAASLTQLTTAAYKALIADLFRREGYEVLAADGPDVDVIDLEATKEHKRYLINCQLRGETDIDLAPLMEMAKVVKANNVSGAFVIADGNFRSDGHAFAWSNGLILIDRPLLLNLVIELTLEDLRKEGLASKLTHSLHPERGHELRHAVLMGGNHRASRRLP